jgi:hypothetical protein
MAKTRKSVQKLDPDDQVRYDALPPALKAQVDKVTDPASKSIMIQTLTMQASQMAAQQTATTATAFQGTAATGQQDTFFEQALGVQAGRRVSVATQQVVPGTATRVGGVTGFLPRYFERDADLMSRFTRDQIADIQAKLKTAGLLGSKYRVGVVDEATKRAWVELLAEANNSNVDYTTALKTAVAQPVGGGGAAKLPPKVSNPQDILSVARQVSRQVLGREDDAILNEIVTAFQRQQVRAQTGKLPVRDGATVAPMDLEVLAERRIRKAAGPEADAFRFAQFAERAFGAGGSGAGVETGEVMP